MHRIVVATTIVLSSTPGFAAKLSAFAELRNTFGENSGSVEFKQDSPADPVTLEILDLSGLEPGEHAIAIFQNEQGSSTCEPTFDKVGSHLNPSGAHHPHHAGDLGNIVVDQNLNVTEKEKTSGTITLKPGRPNSIVGVTTIVVSQGRDDNVTDPDGNAGAKVLCGLI